MNHLIFELSNTSLKINIETKISGFFYNNEHHEGVYFTDDRQCLSVWFLW